MNEEIRHELEFAFVVLKNVLTDNHCSLALNSESKEIYIFPTDEYLNNRSLRGCSVFSIKIDDLVR